MKPVEPGGERRGGGEPSPEDARILAERAAALARPAEVERPGERTGFIHFQLAWERYALDASLVRQVVVLDRLTRLPGAERPVHGVTSWRGELLTVLDLRSVLGLTEKGLTDLGRLLVVGRSGAFFGIVVDAVEASVELDLDALADPPAGAARDAPIRGVAPDGAIVLDGEALIERYTRT